MMTLSNKAVVTMAVVMLFGHAYSQDDPCSTANCGYYTCVKKSDTAYSCEAYGAPWLSACVETTNCAPRASWIGGTNQCLSGTCDCKTRSKCIEDRQCCSGKCESGVCAKSTVVGDYCDYQSCGEGMKCFNEGKNTWVPEGSATEYGSCRYP